MLAPWTERIYYRRWSQQYNDPTHNRFSLCMPYAPIRLFLCKSQTLSSPLCVGGAGGGGQHGGGGGGGGEDYGGQYLQGLCLCFKLLHQPYYNFIKRHTHMFSCCWLWLELPSLRTLYNELQGWQRRRRWRWKTLNYCPVFVSYSEKVADKISFR